MSAVSKDDLLPSDESLVAGPLLEGEGESSETAAAPKLQAIAKPKRNSWALRSVLKVFVNKVDPSYSQPWQKCPQRSGTGSAFVLDTTKRRIMTNAHVVDNATTVYVRRPGIPKKWKATVCCVGKECDLALLTVEEDAFWTEDLRPLEFVDVPDLQSPIAVVGYPVGGDSLSITKGIVSRITMVRYAATTRLLGVQIDAPINPGNSGGPAFSDLEAGSVAGVAFSKNVSATTDNIGYIIPWRIVQHFIEEFDAYQSYRGVCCSGFATQTIENPSHRKFLKVADGRSGCVIVKLEALSEASQQLRTQDVVLEVDGQPIADDETVQFREDERLDYNHVIRSKHIGDKLRLRILRDGQELDVSYSLSSRQPLVPILHGVDCVPSYFIAGGLVFMPLSMPCLEHVLGTKRWRTVAPVQVLAALSEPKSEPDQQIVLLVQILAHEINHGYKFMMVPCETFNGEPVRNLRHLADMVDGCSAEYLRFGLEGGRHVTVDRQEVMRHGPHILETNAIAVDRSPDLLLLTAAAATAP